MVEVGISSERGVCPCGQHPGMGNEKALGWERGALLHLGLGRVGT